ncbi:MAG: alpha/beta fold hydrolase, partial [Anaerolineales bacterium]
MDKKSRHALHGVLWGLGSLVTAAAATAAGWIIYSRRYINHQQTLEKAIDADRNDFDPEEAGRLSYYVDESGKGKPLVLLHSINAASSSFEIKPIFERFRKQRPVYALDLPGFGFSERSERLYCPELYQNAIVSFLKEVVGKPADVIGLSLSCEFAARVAQNNPEAIRSLIMISPTGFNPPRMDRFSESVEQRGIKSAMYAILAVPLWNRPLFDLITSRPSIQFFLSKSFEGSVPERFVDYAYYTAHQPGAAFAPTYFLSGKMFSSTIRKSIYSALELPVLVIYDHDPYTNFEMLPITLRERDNWQAERISPTKGMPHWEQPEKT